MNNVRENNNVLISDNDIKTILFRNFAGKPDDYHKNGQTPNFWVVLEDEKAKELEAQGFNVRWKPNRDGDDEARLQIFVRFEPFPPKVFQITSGGSTLLDEDSIAALDYAELVKVDLVLAPYRYEVNGRKGVKAYLGKGYFTIQEDEFSAQYGY